MRGVCNFAEHGSAPWLTNSISFHEKIMKKARWIIGKSHVFSTNDDYCTDVSFCSIFVPSEKQAKSGVHSRNAAAHLWAMRRMKG